MKDLMIAILAVFMVAMLPFAQAHDLVSASASATATVDAETQAEVEAAISVHGATVRLLQLDKAISRNIVEGKIVVAAIKESNSSTNVTELESILEELVALRAQVGAVNPLNNSKESAQTFVELKHDARVLSAEFKEHAKLLIKTSDLTKVRKRAKEAKDDNEASKLLDRIKKARSEYNAERLERFLANMNMTDAQLVARAKNGNATSATIKAYIHLRFKELKDDVKSDAIVKIREEVSKRKVLRLAVAQEAKINATERKMVRIEQRIEKINDKEKREFVRRVLHSDEKVSARAEARTEARAGPGERVVKSNISTVEVRAE